MKIEFKTVTWYSKLLALIVFIGAIIFAFFLGRDYGVMKNVPEVVEIEVETKVSYEKEVTQPYDTSEDGELRLPLSAVTNDYNVVVNSSFESSKLDCSYITYKNSNDEGRLSRSKECRGDYTWIDDDENLDDVHNIKLTDNLYLLNFVASPNEVFLHSKPSIWRKDSDEIIFDTYIKTPEGRGFNLIRDFYLTNDSIILFDKGFGDDARHSETLVRAYKYNYVNHEIELLYEHRGDTYADGLAMYGYEIIGNTASVIIRRVTCQNDGFDCSYGEILNTIDYDLGVGELFSETTSSIY